MQKYLLIGIVTILLISVYFFFFKSSSKIDGLKIKLNNTNYNFEIASTMAQKAKGLSNRSSLCSNCGMIFIFTKDGIQPFWMKDTLISLDMIWVDSFGKIVSIQTASPEPNTPMTQLKIYQNSTPAKYVIELNANDCSKLNLKIGDTIDLSNLNDQKS
jgi:uncharacterized membrane protein (UPF0127 family)